MSASLTPASAAFLSAGAQFVRVDRPGDDPGRLLRHDRLNRMSLVRRAEVRIAEARDLDA